MQLCRQENHIFLYKSRTEGGRELILPDISGVWKLKAEVASREGGRWRPKKQTGPQINREMRRHKRPRAK